MQLAYTAPKVFAAAAQVQIDRAAANRERMGLQKHIAKSKRASSSHTKPVSEIPDKLYFRIGEVARLCSVQAYVLRFWESEFHQLRPGKSGTGQRLYRRRDVEMALKIRHLLYEEGYTIPGARQAFQQEARSIAEGHTDQKELPLEPRPSLPGTTLKVQRLKSELREILGLLSHPAGKPRLVTRDRAAQDAPALFHD